MGSNTFKIMYLDDDAFERQRVATAFADTTKYQFHGVTHTADLLNQLDAIKDLDLVLLDVHLNDEETSLTAIKAIKKKSPTATILMYSSDLTTVRASLLEGANDFVLKSKNLDELLLRVENIKQQKRTSPPPTNRASDLQLVGATMGQIQQKLLSVVQSAVRTVFVHAESGSGKEVVAAIIKDALPTSTPFFSMNCAALSPQMLESELFGHAKGAFTGALQERKGYLESASGGWLFMDEVANLSLAAQGAILRAIDNQEIIRLGESKVRPIDTRIVCATNESLPDMVKRGTFRNDLWQRLKEVWIEIPPIRERKNEIAEFVAFFAKNAEGGPYTVTPDTMKILEQLDWYQGNVRAIRNCIRAMTAAHVNQALSPSSIPEWVWQEYDANQDTGDKKAIDLSKSSKLTELAVKIPASEANGFPTLERLNDLLLISALRHLCKDGKKSYRSVGTALGLPRSTLFNRVKKLREASLITDADLVAFFGESTEA